jgi:uncharacterized protein (DUF1015 family)
MPVVLSSPAPVASPAGGLEIRPFRAMTYRERDPDRLARMSSPAYDLVAPAERERLAAGDPHNIVRLILPRVDPRPPAEGTPTEVEVQRAAAAAAVRRAAAAAAVLRRWRASGVLQQDTEPALWLYELRPPDGVPPTRGWLAAVALPPPGSPVIMPHEDTYPPAVEGRRALLSATGTDLEPIVLAHDPAPELSGLSDEVQAGEPRLALTDGDAVQHRLWRTTDPDRLAAVAAVLGRTRAVIADGHHRYAAAQANHSDHPGRTGSDAVLALLTPLGAAGPRVEPIHRVVPGLALDTAIEAAAGGFVVVELPLPARGPSGVSAVARDWLRHEGRREFLITDGARLLRLADPAPAVLAAVPQDAPAVWRSLDVVLAQEGLLRGRWSRGAGTFDVQPAHSLSEALRGAVESRGVAVLMRPPTPADVAAVARTGTRMPAKSTLFVPKPRTGLVLRPHDG